MKHNRILIRVCIAATFLSISLVGCNKSTPDQPITKTEQPSVPPPPAIATPAPLVVAPKATPPPATPEPNYLAPEGVFYLTAANSVETSDGVTGLPPGTRAVKQADGRYLANGHIIELRPDQVTNDLRVANHVAGRDQATQAHMRQGGASQLQAHEQKQQEAAQQLNASQQSLAAANAKAGAQRQAKIDAIRKRIATARASKAPSSKIRSLQQELSAMGVAGALLE